MAQIKLEIKSCEDCPFLKKERYYTSDSWEQAYNWFCTKHNDKKIAGYVEWHDKVEIPNWCPIVVKDDNEIDAERQEAINEAKAELTTLMEIKDLVKDNTLACTIEIGDYSFGVCTNSSILPAVENQIREINKFINGEPNDWE